jgi:ureidoglycolate hydrolase
MDRWILPPDLVETGSSFEKQFTPVLKTGDWQVAMLRQCDKVRPDNIQQVERHNNTDEVFILTLGKANLIILEDKDTRLNPYVITMQLNIAYNVKKSVWHHIVLSEDAHVIIFEKADTSRENSEYKTLDADIQEVIREKNRW